MIAMDANTTPQTQHRPGFYVVDGFAPTWDKAIVGGPFDTRALAEARRLNCNIGDDCSVVEVTS